MGDVNNLIGALMRILQGKAVGNLNRFLRYLLPANTTPNKHMMGCAVLFCVAKQEMLDQACEALEIIAAEWERLGPMWRELLCPDPHQGMYDVAWMAIIDHGLVHPNARKQRIAERFLELFGRYHHLHSLIATPDGDVRGLPGERADVQDGIERHEMSALYREINNLPHRGYNGRTRTLDSLCPFDELDGQSGLWYGSAWWWRTMIAKDTHRPLLREEIAIRLLPDRLPLELSIYKWPDGTLAEFTDPGTPEARAEYVTHGSFAAKRSPDKVEDATTAVRVIWVAPARHEVASVLTWRTPTPSKPDDARLVARIPAA